MTLAEELYAQYMMDDCEPQLLPEDMVEDPEGPYAGDGKGFFYLHRGHVPEGRQRYQVVTTFQQRVARKAKRDALAFEGYERELARKLVDEVSRFCENSFLATEDADKIIDKVYQ